MFGNLNNKKEEKYRSRLQRHEKSSFYHENLTNLVPEKNEKWFPTKIGHPHSPELVTHFKYFLSSYDASEMKTPFLHDLKLVDSKKVLCPCSSVLIENNFIIWAVVVKWSTYVPSIWTIWVRILLTWKNIYLVLYEKTKININNGQC